MCKEKQNIWKKMGQHVNIVRGIISKKLNSFVTWFFCTWVFCNGYILSRKEKKYLQTLKVTYEGQPKRAFRSADCTLHNSRRLPSHLSLREGATLFVKGAQGNPAQRCCEKTAGCLPQHGRQCKVLCFRKRSADVRSHSFSKVLLLASPTCLNSRCQRCLLLTKLLLWREGLSWEMNVC